MPTYYTILYRPRGSKTWTPWETPYVRWSTSVESIKSQAKSLRAKRLTRYIVSEKRKVGLEFCVAKVEAIEGKETK